MSEKPSGTIAKPEDDEQKKLTSIPIKALISKSSYKAHSTTTLSEQNSQSIHHPAPAPAPTLAPAPDQPPRSSSKLPSSSASSCTNDRKHHHDQVDRRKYYILTHAGKPVWSTESDDPDRELGDVTSQMGLIQAIISIFEDDHDQLRYIDAGPVKIAVLSKPPLYFLVVSNWGEPESTLQLHLDYLNLLIHSMLSRTQLERIFASRANFDLRGALGGTEMMFEGMVERLQWDLSILVGGLSVYRCPAQMRDRISQLITPIHASPISNIVLYSIVIANQQVISLVRPRNHSVHPSGKNSVGLVVISKDRDGFYACQSWAEEVSKDPVWIELNYLRNYRTSGSSSSSKLGLESDLPISKEDLDRLNIKFNSSLGPGTPSCGDYFLEDLAIPGLRHFVYKDRKFVQVSFPAWDDDYLAEPNRQRLIVNYQKAFDLIHPHKRSNTSNLNSEVPTISTPIKFTFFRNQFETTIGWIDLAHYS